MAKSNSTATAKAEVISWIKALPEDCTLDDIQYHLYVRRKVEAGLANSAKGNLVPHDEAKRRMNEWLKSRGLKRRSTSGKG
jgi:predicted transcriptional regulator